MDKLWYIHISEINRKKWSKLLIHTTWMDLKYIMFSKRTHLKSLYNCVSSFYMTSWKRQTIRIDNRPTGCQGLGAGLDHRGNSSGNSLGY